MFENIIKKINKDAHDRIDNLHDRIVDLEDEVYGYEELLNDVYNKFREIQHQQTVDREMALDLVFSLAAASKIKPASLSKSLNEKILAEYAKKFNESEKEKRKKSIEESVKNAIKAQKSLDKKRK